jgi:hypothetical protein
MTDVDYNFDSDATLPFGSEEFYVKTIYVERIEWCGTNKNLDIFNSRESFKMEVETLGLNEKFQESLINLDHSGPKIKPFSHNIYNYHMALDTMTEFARKTVTAIKECEGDKAKIQEIQEEYFKIIETLNTNPVWQDEGKSDCDKINQTLKGSWGPDRKFHMEE